MLPINYLTLTSLERKEKTRAGILSEKFAIVACGVLIAVFAIPILVVIQALAAIFWGITTVFQLINGKGLFNEGDEL
jgi:hypothetical protein